MSPDEAARPELVVHSVAVMYRRAGCSRASEASSSVGYRSCVGKNALNALGYVMFSMGARCAGGGPPASDRMAGATLSSLPNYIHS